MQSTLASRTIARRSLKKTASSVSSYSEYDANYHKVVFHADGSDIKAVKGSVMTAVGNTLSSTAQSKFGGSSLYFDGTGDYITMDGSSDFAFGTGDFTIEMWVYRTTSGVTQTLIDFRLSEGPYPNLHISNSTNSVNMYYNTAVTITGTTPLPLNAWAHVALCNTNNNIKLYIDGVHQGSAYVNVSSSGVGAGRPILGANGTNPAIQTFTGYLDDIRITKGLCQYTTNFIPPTAAFSTNNPTVDPYKDQVACLIKGDGTNGSTVVTDERGNSLALQGNTNISTTQSKFGGSSIYLDGTGDWINVPNSTIFNFTNKSFTLEGWFYLTTSSVVRSVFGCRNAFAANGWVLYVTSTNKLVLSMHVGSWVDPYILGTANVPSYEWVHIAFTRDTTTNTFRIFLNGELQGSGVYSGAFSYTSNPISIGSAGSNAAEMNLTGYIDDIRITPDVCRYTTSFTVPTQSFPSLAIPESPSADPYITSTTLHLRGGKGAGYAIQDMTGQSRVGGVAVTSNAVTKFGVNSIYTAGGVTNLYDYPGAFAFGTDPFTVEMWVYPTAIGGAQDRCIFTSDAVSASNISLWVKDAGTLGFYASNAWVCSTTTTIAVNTWHHIALVRTYGGGVKLYLDGVASATTTLTTAPVYSNLTLGNNTTGTQGYLGYISEFRVTKGVARYTSNFTPMTDKHYSPNFSETVDPYYPQVVSLIHGDGTNGSTAVTDTKSHALTLTGNTNVSTTQSKFGGSSIYFDGTGDYAALDGSADFAFGTADFTIELWVYPTSFATAMTMYEGRSATANPQVSLYTAVTSGIVYMDTVSATRITSGTGLTLNAWNHVALSRSNGVTKLFIGGVKQGSDYADTNNYSTYASRPYLGSYVNNTSLWVGYIDDLRVTKGTGRYTANFTPENAAFYEPAVNIVTPQRYNPYWNEVTYLAHCNGANGSTVLTDTKKGHVATLVGNTNISTATSAFGGSSLYFDGTGDYVTLDGSNDFAFGTGDFTIEFWVNPTAGVGGFLWDTRPNAVNAGTVMHYASTGTVSPGTGQFSPYPTSITMTMGAWNHIAWSRAAGTSRLFINGVVASSGADTSNYVANTGRPFIGADSNNAGSSVLKGYIDDIRVTKAARYTANFTIPASEFPDY